MRRLLAATGKGNHSGDSGDSRTSTGRVQACDEGHCYSYEGDGGCLRITESSARGGLFQKGGDTANIRYEVVRAPQTARQHRRQAQILGAHREHFASTFFHRKRDMGWRGCSDQTGGRHQHDRWTVAGIEQRFARWRASNLRERHGTRALVGGPFYFRQGHVPISVAQPMARHQLANPNVAAVGYHLRLLLLAVLPLPHDLRHDVTILSCSAAPGSDQDSTSTSPPPSQRENRRRAGNDRSRFINLRYVAPPTAETTISRPRRLHAPCPPLIVARPADHQHHRECSRFDRVQVRYYTVADCAPATSSAVRLEC